MSSCRVLIFTHHVVRIRIQGQLPVIDHPFLIKTSEEMEKHFLQRVINVYMKNNLEMFHEIKEKTPKNEKVKMHKTRKNNRKLLRKSQNFLIRRNGFVQNWECTLYMFGMQCG